MESTVIHRLPNVGFTYNSFSQVLDDGSLFFSKMGVHHMGNYSCEDPNNPDLFVGTNGMAIFTYDINVDKTT